MDIKQFYRLATPKELQFYQQKLYPLQDKVFEIANIYDNQIYLTGGTALARFHFNHRLSEDLDFFTITDDLKYIATDFSARLQNKGFSIKIDRLAVYFSRFYIVEQDFTLKIEFAREYNLIEPLVKTPKHIYSNSLADIGANKISAFEDRAEIKDIIDLYYITQKIPLAQLFKLADAKRVPVAYENLLTINISGISGRALTTHSLDENKLLAFVNTLKQKTEIEIKKKEKITAKNIQPLIERLLWDFPWEDRAINNYSIPVLKRRLEKLSLPERLALEKVLT